MENLVHTAPSAWLTMENALRSLSLDLKALYALLVAFLVVVVVNFTRAGVIDLTWLFAAMMILAIRHTTMFCKGAMERLRQLGQLV